MASTKGILDLVWAEEDPAGTLSDSDRLGQAAEVVDNFVQENSLAALDALIAAAEDGGLSGAEAALATAADITAQTEMLTDEVKRFLDTAPAGQEAAG